MGRVQRLGVHVLLATLLMDDKAREGLISAIATNAPNSLLYKNFPVLQQAVADLIAHGSAYSKQIVLVAATKALLASQTQDLEALRGTVDGDLIFAKGIVEAKGKSPADAKAVGFNTWDPHAGTGPADAPDGVEMTTGRKGKYTFSVKDVLGRKHFSMQLSVDGGHTWLPTDGKGKTRKPVGYASGSPLTVRAAALYGSKLSNWTTPVTFTVP